MRNRIFGLCGLMLALSCVASAKDKPFPQAIVNARYVFVTSYNGAGTADVRVMPDDRQAMADVEDAVRRWGRYILVYERKNADVILLVRKGRIAETQSGVRVHVGSQSSPSVGPVASADAASDPRDMLAVYDASLGTDTPPLWRNFQDDGLLAPDVPLLQELRKQVEAAEKKKP